MPDAVLIFTFSPVQSFISEARRSADLYTGSRILVELAKAAATTLKEYGTLVYPSEVSEDMPNKLVATAPWSQAQEIGEKAQASLLQRWQEIATDTLRQAQDYRFPMDQTWLRIWQRQTQGDYLWQVFWAAASMDSRSYAEAYKQASAAVEAIKRSRAFPPAEEHGVKDSLSGKRTALHTESASSKTYWKAISKIPGVTGSRIRSEGRERLDAIGVVKRFSPLADQLTFASTSTVAAWEFMRSAEAMLSDYRACVEPLLGTHLYRVRSDGEPWPYDGDLLFLDTLTRQRLEGSYGGIAAPEWLPQARQALKDVYKKVDSLPSPYYGIIKLDGDGIGEQVNRCLQDSNPQKAHQQFSHQLSDFSAEVKQMVERQFLIYNGGDDVLALAPLKTALPLARRLAEAFSCAVSGCTASAGIAIAHHLTPLDTALAEAREAEREAKDVKGKAAVCVRVLKRSGEEVSVRSSWEALGDDFDSLVCAFSGGKLSSRLPYEALRSAYALSEANDQYKAELRRLLMRHSSLGESELSDWLDELYKWAKHLPGKTDELGRWLALARFVAQGGND